MRFFPNFAVVAQAFQNIFSANTLWDMPDVSEFSDAVDRARRAREEAESKIGELTSKLDESEVDLEAAIAALRENRVAAYNETLAALKSSEEVLQHYAMGSFEQDALDKLFSSVREYLALAHQDLLGEKALTKGEATVMRAHCAVLKETLDKLVFEGKYDESKKDAADDRPLSVLVAEFFRFIFDYITWAVTFVATFGQMPLEGKNYIAEFTMGQSFFITVPTDEVEAEAINTAKTSLTGTIDNLDTSLDVDDDTASTVSTLTNPSTL